MNFVHDQQNIVAAADVSRIAQEAIRGNHNASLALNRFNSVALSWNASTSANILRYDVYRAVYSSSSCGSYSKINSVLNTGMLYTDSSVVKGTSYCYAATAVNTSNEESAYSNVASNVQIP